MTAPNRTNGKSNEQWDRMCLSKARYSDEYAARASASHLYDVPPEEVRTVAGIPTKLWVYKCVNCRGWHMTKKEVKGSTPITAEGGMFTSSSSS
jgi:hypothetical protein